MKQLIRQFNELAEECQFPLLWKITVVLCAVAFVVLLGLHLYSK